MNYKSREKIFLGVSDIASVVLRGADGIQEIRFGGDGYYHAYIAQSGDEIGSHYNLVATFHHWLWVYDDERKTAEINAPVIKVYRAGDFGCIIQRCDDDGILEES